MTREEAEALVTKRQQEHTVAISNLRQAERARDKAYSRCKCGEWPVSEYGDKCPSCPQD